MSKHVVVAQIVSRETKLKHTICSYLFHVKHKISFSNAEFAENNIEHVLDPHSTSDSTQSPGRQPQIFRQKLQWTGYQGPIQAITTVYQGCSMANPSDYGCE